MLLCALAAELAGAAFFAVRRGGLVWLDRPPTIINMALGAYKQPQQLIALSYLLVLGQHIDLAINVDGFNEFAVGYDNLRNNVEPSLPASFVLAPLIAEMRPTLSTPRYYELAYRLSSAQSAAAVHERLADAARSGIAYGYYTVRASLDRAREKGALTEYDALMTRAATVAEQRRAAGLDEVAARTKSDPFEQLYSVWLESNHQMRVIAAANNVPLLHIVQPNQFFGERKFSTEEAAIALSIPADASFLLGVKGGYPLLAKRAAKIEKSGTVLALPLFDHEERAMYIDNCCHFTAAGETVFARFVATEANRVLTAATRLAPSMASHGTTMYQP
jgi:hypothetical protein